MLICEELPTHLIIEFTVVLRIFIIEKKKMPFTCSSPAKKLEMSIDV
jgi:hypothetical protein